MTSDVHSLPLPEYTEWWASGLAAQHSADHFRNPVETCPGCVASLWLPDIHEAVNDGKLAEIAWGLQDGYGAPGFTPTQGWDWSGIRDSSPAAVRRIAIAVGVLPAP